MQNRFKEIGGYFSLELNSCYDNLKDGLALNSANNCLRYLIRKSQIKKICIPNYTCPSVKRTVEQEECKVVYYNINDKLLPVCDFDSEDYILYTNYFGICAKNVKEMAKKYKNLIVDNAQAFYMPHYGLASIYSIRKFFGVPDGAILKKSERLKFSLEQDLDLKKDESYLNCSHLLKRSDIGAKFGYEDFKLNEKKLENKDIKLISNLSRTIFNSIDINLAKQRRLNNFHFLHKNLKETNKFDISLDADDVPMFYPYIVSNSEKIKKFLINSSIFIPTYWKDTYNDSLSSRLINDLLPLPIDQRYNLEDMKILINLLAEGE